MEINRFRTESSLEKKKEKRERETKDPMYVYISDIVINFLSFFFFFLPRQTFAFFPRAGILRLIMIKNERAWNIPLHRFTLDLAFPS